MIAFLLKSNDLAQPLLSLINAFSAEQTPSALLQASKACDLSVSASSKSRYECSLAPPKIAKPGLPVK
jgi:hypothetical protein